MSWMIFFWWFQLLYYLHVFFSSLFFPHCSNEDFTKQGQGISVEYRIYLSLLEFHLCMYITNTIYMHPWHLPTVSTLWCANSPFFIKLVRYYCKNTTTTYTYIVAYIFFGFWFFAKNEEKTKKPTFMSSHIVHDEIRRKSRNSQHYRLLPKNALKCKQTLCKDLLYTIFIYITGLSQRTSACFWTFLMPLPFVSNFILYNLEILLSNVSISWTPLPLRLLMSYVKAPLPIFLPFFKCLD